MEMNDGPFLDSRQVFTRHQRSIRNAHITIATGTTLALAVACLFLWRVETTNSALTASVKNVQNSAGSGFYFCTDLYRNMGALFAYNMQWGTDADHYSEYNMVSTPPAEGQYAGRYSSRIPNDAFGSSDGPCLRRVWPDTSRTHMSTKMGAGECLKAEGVPETSASKILASQARTTSVSIWFKTGTDSKTVLASFADSLDVTGATSNDDKVLYMDSSGKIKFSVRTTSTIYTASSSTSYRNNAWHHAVAIQSNSPQNIVLYVDGVAFQASPSLPSLTPQLQSNDGWWRIGCSNFYGDWGTELPTGADKWWQEYISQVAVFPRALTGSEVANLYAIGL